MRRVGRVSAPRVRRRARSGVCTRRPSRSIASCRANRPTRASGARRAARWWSMASRSSRCWRGMDQPLRSHIAGRTRNGNTTNRLPRSNFVKAVRYMLERWAGLTRFLDDPRIPLDNNAAERALHYGSRSLRGTEVAAIFYTLCETTRLSASIRRPIYCAPCTRRSIDRVPSRFRKI
jgi:Transposase IS66 family